MISYEAYAKAIDNGETTARKLGAAEAELAKVKLELAKARKAQNILNALREAGVDNWEGYGQALSSLEDDGGGGE